MNARFCLRLSTSLSLLAFVSSLRAESPKRYPIQAFLSTTTYAGASFSPDNKKVLVSRDKSGIFNAYAIPVGGGEAVALTSSKKESVRGKSYFPNNERILYSADQGGNELNHVFVRELDGSIKDLTPGEKLKASFYGWSRDGKSFFAATNERDPRFFDLSLYTVKPTKLRHLTPHEGNINQSAQDFTPDGKGLLITTDRESDFRYLARLDLASNKITEVKRYEWDIVYASYSWKGTCLVVKVNEDSSTDLHLFDAKTMKEMALPKLANRAVGSMPLGQSTTPHDGALALHGTLSGCQEG